MEKRKKLYRPKKNRALLRLSSRARPYNLDAVRKASAGCRACPLWLRGTQTVFIKTDGPEAGRRSGWISTSISGQRIVFITRAFDRYRKTRALPGDNQKGAAKRTTV